MTDNTDDKNLGQETLDTGSSSTTTLSAEHAALLEKLAEEKVAKLKESNNRLDAARKAAVAEAERLRQEKNDAEIQALKEQGKVAEALEKQLEAERAQKNQLLQQVESLTRDRSLEDALVKYEFRNARARQMTFEQVVRTLVKDSDGNWVHKSGASISDYVAAFLKDEENSFVLKPKLNSGAGGQASDTLPPGSAKRPPSLTGLTGPQLLELAQKGALK